MPRIFAYAQVSKIDQETESQIKEIESMTETISGSMPSGWHSEFSEI